MEEAHKEPPYFVLPNEYFTIFEGGRQRLLSGRQPAEVNAPRGIRARDWRAYQNRMAEEPPWERAKRYRRLMEEKGYRSIRALAKAIGEDHSRIARALKVLDFPESALEVLRRHAADARIRAHFTEKRLRRMAGTRRRSCGRSSESSRPVPDATRQRCFATCRGGRPRGLER